MSKLFRQLDKLIKDAGCVVTWTPKRTKLDEAMDCVELFYRHLDRFGEFGDHSIPIIESQDACFEAYHNLKKGFQNTDD